MPIPDFQAIMLPLLELLSSGNEWSMNDAINKLEDTFQLTAAERAEMQPSGTLRLFQNRAHWAKFHLKKAGLIENPRRGVVSLSDAGHDVLRNAPEKIDIPFLRQFASYQEFRDQGTRHGSSGESDVESLPLAPPYDQLFGTFANANCVLERFAEVLHRLHCTVDEQDVRISVGLQRLSGQRVRLRLIYAKWAVFGFRVVRGIGAYQVVLPQDDKYSEILESPFEFAETINDQTYVLGWVPESILEERNGDLWKTILNAIDAIAQQFSHWTSSPYAGTNRPELYSIILNEDQRLDVLQTVADEITADDESPSPEYWLIAPGQGAKFWFEWQRESVIDIGWEDVGSLDAFETKEDLIAGVEAAYPDEGARRVAWMLWQFSDVMKPGDVVFVKRGRLHVVGWGVVTSDYRFSSSRTPHPHVRSVSWKNITEVLLPEERLLAMQTLTSMSDKTDFLEVMASHYGDIPGIETSKSIPDAEGSQQYWWLNANPSMWDPSQMPIGYEEFYSPYNERGAARRQHQAFQQAMTGDSILIYVTSPHKYLWGKATVTASLHDTNNQELRFQLDEAFATRVSLEQMKAEPSLAHCVPLIQPQGSLFPLAAEEYAALSRMAHPETVEAQASRTVYTRADATNELFMPEEKLDRIVALLRRKRNVILQGAPGTGKTFVARRIAYLLMEEADPSRAPMVQFHQSTSYEDFVQGYRPDGIGGFVLKNGTFHDFCRAALLCPEKPFVFIIDEINRGNLSKVFGELMMLIESDKRHSQFAVPLSYSSTSDDTFFVPPNVYLLGTMNSADRSLSLVDFALRRRFAFIELEPGFDSPQFAAVLRERGVNDGTIAQIKTRMTRLNELIRDDASNLGRGYCIGHSFFVPAKAAEIFDDWLQEVIEYEIIPLVEEYWVDDAKKRSQALSILRGL